MTQFSRPGERDTSKRHDEDDLESQGGVKFLAERGTVGCMFFKCNSYRHAIYPRTAPFALGRGRIRGTRATRIFSVGLFQLETNDLTDGALNGSFQSRKAMCKTET